MRIYISGAMSSRMDVYRAEFSKVEQRLKEEGHIVINPAALPVGLDSDKYMPICLSMIDGADVVYLFGDWKSSKGAVLEKAYAEYQGKEVVYGE